MTNLKSSAFAPLMIIFAVLVAWVGLSYYRSSGGGKEVVPWRMDVAAARAEAKAQNKPVLLYFTASWCGPCQQMKRTTFTEVSVEKAMEAYVPVKVDVDQNQALGMQHGVTSIPQFVILPAGADLGSRTLTGYQPAESLIGFLNENRAGASTQPAK